MKKDVVSILDLTAEEFAGVIDLALLLKDQRARGEDHSLAKPYTLGMIFEKASTRTRISFEVGMFELGGHALFLNPNDMQLGRGEIVEDTAQVLSRYLSAVMIRSNSHETVTKLADHATIPVINGLSDLEHPCQILADAMTMRERFGTLEGLEIAWVGDGNNVCNSLILASALAGYRIRVATPGGTYAPNASILETADAIGASYTICATPAEAVAGADVIYTDTWISMGDEEEKEERLRAFDGFCVDAALLAAASERAVVMHCLPAHRGEEIAPDVIDGEQSVVFDQAENRLHAQKALLSLLLEGVGH